MTLPTTISRPTCSWASQLGIRWRRTAVTPLALVMVSFTYRAALSRTLLPGFRFRGPAIARVRGQGAPA